MIRTTIMIPADLDAALRQKAAAGNRPISHEIRAALQKHVAKAK